MVRRQTKTSGIVVIAILSLLLLNSSAVVLSQRAHSASSLLLRGALDVGEGPPQDNSGGNQTSQGDQAENDTNSLQNDQNLNGTNSLHFALVPANSSVAGHGEADLEFEGTNVTVHAEFADTKPGLNNTSWTLVLTVNGTDHVLGTGVADNEGDGEIEAQYNLGAPGTYSLSVSIVLGSSAVLVSDPASQNATVGNSSSSEGDGGDSGNSTEGDAVAAVPLGQFEQGQLQLAQSTQKIPGVVSYTGTNAHISVTDSRFSLSAGTLLGTGLLVQIAGTNVAGARVVMINLARGFDFTSHRLLLTLDGVRVSQAASLTQLLQSTGKSAYLLASTSTGLSLLVSIPQFLSAHTISILQTAAAQGLFQISGITMLESMLVIGAIFVTIYSTRKVYVPAIG